MNTQTQQNQTRPQKRAAAKNGQKLPVLTVMLYDDGQVRVDTDAGITQEQTIEFVYQLLKRMESENG